MKVDVKVTQKGKGNTAALNDLLLRDVLVGIPSGSARTPVAGQKTTMDNAELGYIHEYGAPEANIPARPFLIPGIESVNDRIAAKLKSAIVKAMSGDRRGVEDAFNDIGLTAQAAVRRKILNGPFEPLSERTLEARARRLTPAGKLSKTASSKQAREELAARRSGLAASAANAKPLYDTHSLFNSVNYIVRGKGPKS